VVLPGYNERHSLAAAVHRYLDALPRCGIDSFEIIVVNDGSTDGSGELADGLARTDPRVRVLHHERNLGQVAGILSGFRAARGGILTHNGMDLPFEPADTARALEHFAQGADLVVVERANRQSYGITRKIVSWCNIMLLRVLFRTPFYDHNFTQFFRCEVFQSVTVRSTGVSTVTPELIFRSLRRGYRAVSMSATYHPRQAGQSTITLRKTLHAFWQTLRLRWLMRLAD
jgi:glycosyltransferase involved in cell wall biosynthesis